MRRSHPHVGVRRILDFGPDSNALQLRWKDVKHNPSIDERRSPEWDLELVSRAVVIPYALAKTLRYRHAIQSGDLWRREIIQGSVNMPTIEARVPLRFVFRRNPGLMESGMRGVLELRLSETLMVVDGPVSDELHLRDMGDSLQVGVENRLLLALSLLVTMPIAFRGRVESLLVVRMD